MAAEIVTVMTDRFMLYKMTSFASANFIPISHQRCSLKMSIHSHWFFLLFSHIHKINTFI